LPCRILKIYWAAALTSLGSVGYRGSQYLAFCLQGPAYLSLGWSGLSIPPAADEDSAGPGSEGPHPHASPGFSNLSLRLAELRFPRERGWLCLPTKELAEGVKGFSRQGEGCTVKVKISHKKNNSQVTKASNSLVGTSEAIRLLAKNKTLSNSFSDTLGPENPLFPFYKKGVGTGSLKQSMYLYPTPTGCKGGDADLLLPLFLKLKGPVLLTLDPSNLGLNKPGEGMSMRLWSPVKTAEANPLPSIKQEPWLGLQKVEGAALLETERRGFASTNNTAYRIAEGNSTPIPSRSG